MVFIRKQHPNKKVAEEISRCCKEFNDKRIKTDPEVARLAFDHLDKVEIRKQLLSEQRYLCAYCMRRIDDDNSTSIEHFLPVHRAPEKVLSYDNLLVCCDGGRSNSKDRHVLCCDAAKGDLIMTIDPRNEGHMNIIRYDKEGRIYTFPRDEELEKDINNVLCLNGKLDKEGNTICDTSTNVVQGRRQVYNSYVNYLRKLIKDKRNIKSSIEKKLKELDEMESAIEYVGVWKYFLRRKLREV